MSPMFFHLFCELYAVSKKRLDSHIEENLTKEAVKYTVKIVTWRIASPPSGM